jgi:hypothetical protein
MKAAGEERAQPFAAELDGRTDDVEPHVARPEHLRPGPKLRHRELDALVAAAQALDVAQAAGADAVLRRNDDALAVVDDEAVGVGERQLDAPPAADGLADLAHDLKLFQSREVDRHRVST